MPQLGGTDYSGTGSWYGARKLGNFGATGPQANSMVDLFGSMPISSPAPVSPSIEQVAADIMDLNQKSYVAPPPAAAPKSAPTRSILPSSPSTSSGSTGGLGGFGAISDTTAPAPVAPVAPAIPTAASDPGYQAQMAALAKAMADYQNQIGLENSQYDQSYNDSLRMLGWNPTANSFDPTNLQGQYGQAYAANDEDFASRGLRASGLFEKSRGDLATNFLRRKTDFDTAQQGFRDTQNQKLRAFENQNEATETQALMEAIARIAGKYQIDPSQVLSGL